MCNYSFLCCWLLGTVRPHALSPLPTRALAYATCILREGGAEGNDGQFFLFPLLRESNGNIRLFSVHWHTADRQISCTKGARRQPRAEGGWHNRDFRIFPLPKPGEQARDPEDQHVLPTRPLLRHLLRRPRPCRGGGPGEEKKKEKKHLFEIKKIYYHLPAQRFLQEVLHAVQAVQGHVR